MSKDGMSGIYWQHLADAAPQEHKLKILSGEVEKQVSLNQMIKLAMNTDIATAILSSDFFETYLENLTPQELFKLGSNHYALAERVMTHLETHSQLTTTELYFQAIKHPIIAMAIFHNPKMINSLSPLQSLSIVETHESMLIDETVGKVLSYKLTVTQLLELGFKQPSHLNRLASTKLLQNELINGSSLTRSQVNNAFIERSYLRQFLLESPFKVLLNQESLIQAAQEELKVAMQLYADASLKEKLSISQLVRIGCVQPWFAQRLIDEIIFCQEVEEEDLVELAKVSAYVARKILDDDFLCSKINSLVSWLILAEYYAFIAENLLKERKVLEQLTGAQLLALSLRYYFFAEHVLTNNVLRSKLLCSDVSKLCAAHPGLFEKHKASLNQFMNDIFADYSAHTQTELSRLGATVNLLSFMNCLAGEQLAQLAESSSDTDFSFESSSLEDVDEACQTPSFSPASPRVGIP